MTFLDKIERVLGRYAISNLALYIVIGQVFVLLMAMLGKVDVSRLLLVPMLVIHGEWWRLFTFILIPPAPGFLGYIFIAFALYIFYLMGSALEEEWGAFKFNLFLLTGWVLTVGSAFLLPFSLTSNTFIAGSVFLAFAFRNPNFELMLFFILPLKIKWLALFTWLVYAYSFATGTGSTRLQIMASVGNFLIFFAPEMIRGAKQRRRHLEREEQRLKEKDEPRHRCYVCGKTDRTHPQMDFRYCSKCAGDECYCSEHIRSHVHTVAGIPDEKKS